MLGLAFTDHANRSATFDVTGTGGASVTVYRQRVTGSPAGMGWGVAGTRTGDGPVGPVGMNEGVYWFSAATATEWSAPTLGTVTSGATPVSVRLRAAVVAQIGLANLPDLEGQIYERKYWDDVNVTYPCVIVCLYAGGPMQETYVDGTNAKSDWGRPMFVVMGQRIGDNDPKTSILENWRERLFRAFDHQRLPGMPEGYHSVVEPGPVFNYEKDPDGKMIFGTDFSGFVVRLTTREPRGLGT